MISSLDTIPLLIDDHRRSRPDAIVARALMVSRDLVLRMSHNYRSRKARFNVDGSQKDRRPIALNGRSQLCQRRESAKQCRHDPVAQRRSEV